MLTLSEGFFFSSLLALIQILCPSLWLCGLFAEELLCIGVLPFREHVCAQLWKTAHCLTKGSKSLDTFCLSPLLYAWWKRKDAEYFPSHRSMIFHFKCRVPLAGLQEHLRREGSTPRNGMKFSSTQTVYLKRFLKQAVALGNTSKSPVSPKRRWNPSWTVVFEPR